MIHGWREHDRAESNLANGILTQWQYPPRLRDECPPQRHRCVVEMYGSKS